MDLPKGGRRITYVLDPSPITWSKTNLEMDKKLERTSSLENPNHIVGCHAFLKNPNHIVGCHAFH